MVPRQRPRPAAARTAVLAVLALTLPAAGCAAGPAPRWATGTRSASEWQGSAEAGRKVLAKGREMVRRGEILPGGCWDYINAVYARAGFPEGRRGKVFASVKKGPYADPALLRPGDWVYFVNHSYGGIQHSAVFVEWVNRGARQATMLSYAGEKRREPGRYLTYDLSNIYGITRPRP